MKVRAHLAAATLVFAAAATTGPAATLTVCSAACAFTTIQDAVNAALPGDVIDIAAGTYPGDVDISVANLTFQGAGAGVTFIDGLGFASLIFRAAASPAVVRNLTLRSPAAVSCLYNYEASLTVEDATVEDCAATQQVGPSYVGGAIYTTGDLVLRRVTVQDNTAWPTADGLGGGLFVRYDPLAGVPAPVVRIYDSTFTGNSAMSGGAIYVEPGARLFVDSSTLSGNTADGTTVANNYTGRGGAIFSGGDTDVTACTVADNFADQSGGGIAVTGSAAVTIANSTFTNNETTVLYSFPPWFTGGGVFVESTGDVTITGSLFEGNYARLGGAIGTYNLLGGGKVTVTGSTLSDNTALYGGGAYAIGGQPFVIARSTITGNTALQTGSGAGVHSTLAADLQIRDSTISGNTSQGTGGGVANGGATPSLRNTIVAGNTALVAAAGGGSTDDCSGSLTSNDFNLVGTLDGCSWFAQPDDLSGTDAAPLDPLLGPLADNGGLTQTLLPAAGSPAIDTGGACTARDQRSFGRPVDGGSGVVECDRGAVEVAATCSAPANASLPDPVSGAFGIANPLLVWEPGFGANAYTTVLSTSPLILGGTIARTAGQTELHWKPGARLAPATTYYWRVAGTSECGAVSFGPIWNFTTP